MFNIALLCSFLSILVSGCGIFYQSPFHKEIREISIIQNNTANKIENKYQIYPIGTGISIPGGDFRGFSLSLQKKDNATPLEAEQVLFEAAYDLLDQVNRNEVLKPIMAAYPFTLKQITVTLYLRDENGHELFHPEPVTISLVEGEFRYLTFDKEEERGVFIREYPASESKYYRGEK